MTPHHLGDLPVVLVPPPCDLEVCLYVGEGLVGRFFVLPSHHIVIDHSRFLHAIVESCDHAVIGDRLSSYLGDVYATIEPHELEENQNKLSDPY